MKETPFHLRERTRQSQARVPSLGLGFKKMLLDREIHETLLNHYRSHVRDFRGEQGDEWLESENESAHPALVFADANFNLAVREQLKASHEEWSGLELIGTSCYGIRVYQSGAYLFNHVDTIDTHVVSSTICIDQRLNRPWPLYIEDHDGNPHEISIEPGEMVFYESAKLVHGRPYPLDGDYYAGMFVHYAPVDWELA